MDEKPLSWTHNFSTPTWDIDQARKLLLRKRGAFPNKALLTLDEAFALMNHPDALERMRASAINPVTEEWLEQLFGVEQIVIIAAASDLSRRLDSLYDPQQCGQADAYVGYSSKAVISYS